MSDLALTAVQQLQDRALLLLSERGRRDLAVQEQREAQAVVDAEEERCNSLRQQWLSSHRSRYGLELDVRNLLDRQRDEKLQLSKVQREMEDLQQIVTSRDAKLRETSQTFYAPHRTKRALYQTYLELFIAKRQRQVQLEHDRLQFLEKCTVDRKIKEQDYVNQIIQMDQESQLIDGQEQQEDEEISSLGLQIKATLSKVRIPVHISHCINLFFDF
jgi:hypothetical protein